MNGLAPDCKKWTQIALKIHEITQMGSILKAKGLIITVDVGILGKEKTNNLFRHTLSISWEQFMKFYASNKITHLFTPILIGILVSDGASSHEGGRTSRKSHLNVPYRKGQARHPEAAFIAGSHGIAHTSSRSGHPLRMSRKVTYGYRYNPEKVKRKGTVRSQIYFDMWKDKDPYYVIHKFLYENDPDNPNFKYDIDLARKPKCTRNIFAHYKKDNRLRFFWYASRKNSAKGPCSRYINYALDRNEFRFSKLRSYFHILPYVHEHYKDDPRYIYFMNRFLSRHGRVAEFKRLNRAHNSDSAGETTESQEGQSAPSGERDAESSSENIVKRYRREISWKEMLRKAKEEEEELFAKISTPPIEVDLGEGRSFTVKRDGFKVYGEYFSTIDKKNRKSPYDIYSPFLRTKYSSKRRRFREKIPLDPSLRCKTRRERIRRNAEKRDVKAFIKKYLKQIPKST